MRDRRADASVNNGKQLLDQLADKDKDKDKDKDISTTAPAVPAEFDQFKEIYPLRSGSQPWSRALKVIRARLEEGNQWADLIDGARRYAAYCNAVDKTGTEYVMQAATFCGPEFHFRDLWKPPRKKTKVQQDKNIEAALKFMELASEDG